MTRDATAAKTLGIARRILTTCERFVEIRDGGAAAYHSDFRVQWAVAMGFIRLGEDVSRLPESVRERFDEQPWHQIIGLRDFAAHQYDGLMPDLAWETVARDLPALHEYVRDVMIPALEAGAAPDSEPESSDC